MNGNFKQIKDAVSNLFNQELSPEEIAKLRAGRAAGIVEAKGLFTPEVLQAIAADAMPENLEITREAYVAMAQIAMDALNLVESIVSGVGVSATPSNQPKH